MSDSTTTTGTTATAWNTGAADVLASSAAIVRKEAATIAQSWSKMSDRFKTIAVAIVTVRATISRTTDAGDIVHDWNGRSTAYRTWYQTNVKELLIAKMGEEEAARAMDALKPHVQAAVKATAPEAELAALGVKTAAQRAAGTTGNQSAAGSGDEERTTRLPDVEAVAGSILDGLSHLSSRVEKMSAKEFASLGKLLEAAAASLADLTAKVEETDAARQAEIAAAKTAKTAKTA